MIRIQHTAVGTGCTLWATLLALLLFTAPCQAQQGGGKPKASCDTIVLTSGRKIGCNVRTVSATQVSYYLPGNKKERTYQRRNVHKILYASGKIEKLSDLAYEAIADSDWRIIILTDDPEMVEGLYSHGMVFGESNKSSRTLRVAKRNAETRIKKRAVAKKGIIVLITKRTTTGGYGEVPKYYIEGEVYGTEPPEEGDLEDSNVPHGDD